MRGYLNDKKVFKTRLLRECEQTPSRPLVTLDHLERRAASLYSDTPTTETVLPPIQDADFLRGEKDPILSRRIIGKTDVDIAAMIQKLGSSDWVQQGVKYLENSDGACPFCQQSVASTLSKSLAEYFDETFVRDTELLSQLETSYKLEGERLQKSLDQLSLTSARFFDVERLKTEKTIFDTRLSANVQRIATKIKEPSQLVTLEPLGNVLQAIRDLVTTADSQISAHNVMVANLATERLRLTEDMWAFLAQSEIANAYNIFCSRRMTAQKTIDAISVKIAKAHEAREGHEAHIRQLEKSVTSIQPTINEINLLLRGFGFRSFFLKAVARNCYGLCRNDGSGAQETLSEGERSFITFLYFFHLLKGNYFEAGLNTDRIVVFDDPVSSLTATSSLLSARSSSKRSKKRAGNRESSSKSSFSRTTSFSTKKSFSMQTAKVRLRGSTRHSGRSGGINDASTIQRHTSIPIKTAYELLWNPLRQPNLADQSLQNNMRRILEHYFRVLGGVSFDDILNKFDGEEELTCRSLLLWVHDGSHGVADDLFHTLHGSAMQRYIAVFQHIFVRLGHANHYNMMMGFPSVIIAEAAQGRADSFIDTVSANYNGKQAIWN